MHNLNWDLSHFLGSAKERVEKSGNVDFIYYLLTEIFESIRCSYPLRSGEWTNVRFYFFQYGMLLIIENFVFSLVWNEGLPHGRILFCICVLIITCGTPDSYSSQSWKTSSRSFNTTNKHLCYFFPQSGTLSIVPVLQVTEALRGKRKVSVFTGYCNYFQTI